MKINRELAEPFCPETLQKLRAWALWRLEKREGQSKPAKMPYQAQNGSLQPVRLPKRSDGSADWMSGPWTDYDTACAVLQANPGDYGGLDLALLPGSGIVALDMDHCIGPDGTVSGAAAEILPRIQGKTYVELSQSGSGLHAFFLGRLPDGLESFNNQTQGVEMYTARHYIAMTHRALPGCAVEPAADLQELINDLVDRYRPAPAAGTAESDAAAGEPGHCDMSAEEVIRRASNSRQGEKFKRLFYDDDISLYGDDRSRADQGLARILAFWCERDPDLMEEVFSQSALAARDKWNVRANYRERTIMTAIRSCKQTRLEGLEVQREEILASFPAGCWDDTDALEWIFSQRRKEFHFFKKVKKDEETIETPTNVNHRAVCDALAELPLLVIDGQPWLYSGGAYRQDVMEVHTRALIRACLFDKFCTSRNINQILEQLLHLPRLQAKFDEMNNFPRGYIVFQNCVFDAETGEVHEHSPEFRAINQIPRDFLPGEAQDGGPVDTFVGGLWPDPDDQRFVWELVGSTMLARVRPEFFVILHGAGGLGKSVFLNLLRDALGPDNTTSLSLGQVQEKFLTIGLRGCLATICGDLNSEALDKVDILKRMTGGDEIPGEIKHVSHPVRFFNSATPWFSANRVPQQKDDASDAFWRRLKILSVRQRAPEIPDVENALRGDVQTFLTRAVAGAQRVLANGGHVVDSESCSTAVRELRQLNDPVAAFLDNRCETGDDLRVKADDLFSAFNVFCLSYRDANGEHCRDMTRKQFYDDLREKGFNDVRISTGLFFKGIAIRARALNTA